MIKKIMFSLRLSFSVAFFFFVSVVFAQNGAIKGRIIDAETNETLVGASAIIEGAYNGAVADLSGVEADGNFDGNFPAHENQSNFTIRNMTIDLRLAASDDPTRQMNNVLKIRRGAKATICATNIFSWTGYQF